MGCRLQHYNSRFVTDSRIYRPVFLVSSIQFLTCLFTFIDKSLRFGGRQVQLLQADGEFFEACSNKY